MLDPCTVRAEPADAGRLIDENILPYFEIVALSASDYAAVLRSASAAGLVGAVVFDALHLHAAIKAHCDRIHTLNVRDFRALAPLEMRTKIFEP